MERVKFTLLEALIWTCFFYEAIDFTYSFEQPNLVGEVYDTGIQNAMQLVRDNSEPKTEESDERFQALGSSYWSVELRYRRHMPLRQLRILGCWPGSAISQEQLYACR